MDEHCLPILFATSRAFVIEFYGWVITSWPIEKWNDYVEPFQGNAVKFQLEMLKVGIASIVFFFSTDNNLKLGTAIGISIITIFNLLPNVDSVIVAYVVGFTYLREELVIVKDSLQILWIINVLSTHVMLLVISLVSHIVFVIMIISVKIVTFTFWSLEWLVRRFRICFKSNRVAPSSSKTIVDLLLDGLENGSPQDDLEGKSDEPFNNDSLRGEHEEDDENEASSLLARVFGRLTISDRQVAASVAEPPLDPHSDLYFTDLLDRALRQAPRMQFCYLKCLDPVDQITFKNTMVRLIKRNYNDIEIQERIILQGCMRMGTWRTIMQRIPLTCKYMLWRPAYWGENAGRTHFSTATSRYHVLVDEFGPKNGFFVIINLVHTEGHIEEVHRALIYPAKHFNPDASQSLWDEMSF